MHDTKVCCVVFVVFILYIACHCYDLIARHCTSLQVFSIYITLLTSLRFITTAHNCTQLLSITLHYSPLYFTTYHSLHATAFRCSPLHKIPTCHWTSLYFTARHCTVVVTTVYHIRAYIDLHIYCCNIHVTCVPKMESFAPAAHFVSTCPLPL